MGSRIVRFNFTAGENYQHEAVLKMPEESRSIIHGVVRDHQNNIVKDAVVKLFEVTDPTDINALKPVTHAFTDDIGEFLFGPLTAGKNYAVKVWVNNVKTNELIIYPDGCEEIQHDKNTEAGARQEVGRVQQCDEAKHDDEEEV